jgi:nucleotide-binding universal stress UspA family protein
MSEVRVIAVNDPLTPTLIGQLVPPVRRIVEETNEADREWLRKILALATEQLRWSGLTVSTQVREGDPKKELPSAAQEWGADCIFVASSGFSNRFERFVLGSVSAAVAARAHCSVEVVRSISKNN